MNSATGLRHTHTEKKKKFLYSNCILTQTLDKQHKLLKQFMLLKHRKFVIHQREQQSGVEEGA